MTRQVSETETESVDTGKTSRVSKKSGEKEALWKPIDRLFRIAAVSYKSRDGSGRVFTLEHRVGRHGGVFNTESLMKRTMLEKEFVARCTKLEKKITNRSEFDHVVDSLYATQKENLRKMIASWRTYLRKFYNGQGLKPCVSFVPVDGNDTALFIQGFIDIKTKVPVVGDVGDMALWSETVFVRSQSLADMNKEAQEVAKKIIKLPHVNRDIILRMEMVANGRLEMGMNLLPSNVK